MSQLCLRLLLRSQANTLRRSSLLPKLRPYASSRKASNQVRLVEVGPRDGLQNEKNIVPLENKIELIHRLAKTGLTDIEAGAFVSPKWVPQMANSAEILEHLYTNPPEASQPISYPFLVPNLKGLESALTIAKKHNALSNPILSDSPQVDLNAPPTPPQTPPLQSSSSTSGLTEIALFCAATESFSQKNINCSIADSLERFAPVIALAHSHGIKIRAYISVVLGCPYEGPPTAQSLATVAALSQSLLEQGCHEISLGDTTGMGTASTTLHLLQTLESAGVPLSKVAGHFHDTYGQAVVNTLVSLEKGVRVFDSSVGGLGGCPYAKGATGNVATEEMVYFLESVGMQTGVDIEKLADVGDWISKELEKENGSRVGKAMIAKRE